MHKLIPIALVVVAACVPQRTDLYGSGPVPKLAPQIERALAVYMARTDLDRAFAISPDGNFAGHSHCETYGTIGRCNNNEFLALSACERLAKQKCYIYATDAKVVWNTAAPAPGQPVTTQTHQVSVPNPPRMIDYDATFEIGANKYFGKMSNINTNGMDLFTIDTPEGKCSGSANIAGGQGSWSLSCPNQLTAAGRIISATPSGVVGEGRDSTGRLVRFNTIRSAN